MLYFAIKRYGTGAAQVGADYQADACRVAPLCVLAHELIDFGNQILSSGGEDKDAVFCWLIGFPLC